METERTETFTEYFVRKKSHKAGHKHKVTGSWGVYDYYKYYRHNKPKDEKYVLDCGTYYKIIRMVNEAMADKLAKEHRIELPNRMGVLEFLKYPHKLKIVDGKVVTTRSVDWFATMKLWYEDPEAERKKILIRRENDEGTKAHYRKSNAVYNNRFFYEFEVHRTVKRKYKEFAEASGYGTPFLMSDININDLYK